MAEDLQANLQNYKLQYQQVETALTSDPENEDLLKLQNDLHEVISLTEDLITSQEASATTSGKDGATGTQVASAEPSHSWRVGEKCVALWSEDQQYYEASIDEILDDGTCTVTFDNFDNTDITKISLLKSIEEGGSKRSADGQDGSASKKPKTKKDMAVAQREYKKKKAQKKATRIKAMEEERETEKNKWLDFNSKLFSKTSKGKPKKSIFATPENAGGRVGVGTCGVSGKPMTSFTQLEKWKK